MIVFECVGCDQSVGQGGGLCPHCSVPEPTRCACCGDAIRGRAHADPQIAICGLERDTLCQRCYRIASAGPAA